MGRTFLPLLLALAAPLLSCEGGGQNGYREQKAKRMAAQDQSRQRPLAGDDSLTPEKPAASNGYLEARIRRQTAQDSSFAARKAPPTTAAADTTPPALTPYEQQKLRRIQEQQENKRTLDW